MAVHWSLPKHTLPRWHIIWKHCHLMSGTKWCYEWTLHIRKVINIRKQRNCFVNSINISTIWAMTFLRIANATLYHAIMKFCVDSSQHTRTIPQYVDTFYCEINMFFPNWLRLARISRINQRIGRKESPICQSLSHVFFYFRSFLFVKIFFCFSIYLSRYNWFSNQFFFHFVCI